jgi:acyl carrier protein
MNRNEMMAKLQDIIREAVDDEDVVIYDTTVASDVEGWDSLAQVLIIGSIQKELGMKFTSTEVSKLSNVGEFVDAMMSKQ